MIQSMTGYGAATAESTNYRIRIELKSLNSKFLEVGIKLPHQFLQYELQVRNILNQKVIRGKIMGTVNIEVTNPDLLHLRINESRLKAYTNELRELAKRLGLNQEFQLEFLLGLPNVIEEEEKVEDAEEWTLIERAMNDAIDALVKSRTEEGKALEIDLRTRCDLILISLAEVDLLKNKRIENIRTRLHNSLIEIKDRVQVDENRFEQEILYYIEKLDINEEIVRLRKHVEYFYTSLSEKDSNGRKLGFIGQEMGREMNTIGAKANDALVQVSVVKMKEELEKIKEQINNIL